MLILVRSSGIFSPALILTIHSISAYELFKRKKIYKYKKGRASVKIVNPSAYMSEYASFFIKDYSIVAIKVYFDLIHV